MPLFVTSRASSTTLACALGYGLSAGARVLLLIVIVFSSFAMNTAVANTILVLGDSLSAAYGMPIEKGWVALLENQLSDEDLEWAVVNASISGATTNNGVAQLPELLKQHKPQVVLLELGGNDGLRTFPYSVTYNNLEKMIAMTLGAKARPILVEIDLPKNYGRSYRKRFRTLFSKLSEKYSVPVISFVVDSDVDKASLLQSDGLHPNERAQPIMLGKAWPVILEVVEEIEYNY